VLSVGEESDAIDKHEAVLGSLEALVRMQPADLSLLADPLTHAVLSLENRFNLQVFSLFVFIQSEVVLSLISCHWCRVSMHSVAAF